MIHPARARLSLARLRAWPALALLAVAFAITRLDAQSASRASAGPAASTRAATPPSTDRKVLSADDYSRWRSIDDATISPDGKWAAYVLRYTNVLPADARPALRLRNLDTDQEVEIAHATAPQFSPDSRWIVYQVEIPNRARGARPGAGADSSTVDSVPPPTAPSPNQVVSPTVPPGAQPAPGAPVPITPSDTNPRQTARPPADPPRRAELRELATGRTQRWQDVQTATFSPTSTHLLLRRRAAGAAGAAAGRAGGPGQGGGGGGGSGGGDAASRSAGGRGVDVLLHDLATGRTRYFGSVGDASFNRPGSLLAYTVDATVRDGNGLFVVDLASGSLHALDNDARLYSRLTWNDAGTGLAVLKGREVERRRERDNVLLVFPDVRAAAGDAEAEPAVLDPARASGFPRNWVVSERASLEWSDDGQRVFFGTMPQTAAPDTGRRRSTDSIADVDIWRTQDERIQSMQMIRAEADRNFTFRQAFVVPTATYVRLADSTMREVSIAPGGKWAIGRDVRGYIHDYNPSAADLYRINTATGERTLIAKGQLTGPFLGGASPDGKHYLYWKDSRYHSYDLDAGSQRVLGSGAPSFVDMEYDRPGPRPPYGVSGFTADGSGVIVEGRYDLWLLPLDGTSSARNLTNGAGTRDEVRFRLVRTIPTDPLAPRAEREKGFDLSRPLTLSAYGEYTKKSGFYELSDGRLREIVYEDAMYGTPERAAKADRFLLTRQTFREFPDLRVSGPDFADSKKISDANPQQSEYVWGRRVLFEYRNKSGVRLQGILALPDDYVAGQKRPMLVTFYEKNSQNMHRYPAPSFLTGMGSSPVEAVSRGYITMLPDIHFSTGRSHSDMLECVEAAVKKVIELGYADPRRIGVSGHSYGGEGAAFIGTRSKMFAAVGMGAGVTDLYSDFSQSWGWSYQVTGGSGANGNNYYLYGQGRWGFSPWDKPDVYRYESAITHAPTASAPFLIMHGTADPTVSFTEGMNFYNALRYNGKEAILLAYPGEGHGLRGVANRRDLTIRYFQFFDHYLKGAPAPKWMTEGVPYIFKDQVRTPE